MSSAGPEGHLSRKINPDDVIIMPSGLPLIGLGDYKFKTENLCYKLGE